MSSAEFNHIAPKDPLQAAVEVGYITVVQHVQLGSAKMHNMGIVLLDWGYTLYGGMTLDRPDEKHGEQYGEMLNLLAPGSAQIVRERTARIDEQRLVVCSFQGMLKTMSNKRRNQRRLAKDGYELFPMMRPEPGHSQIVDLLH